MIRFVLQAMEATKTSALLLYVLAVE